MKAYRIEVLIIDFEEIGGEVIAELMERVRYPNDCVSPLVMSQQEADIGTWSDDHALNHGKTLRAEYERLFDVASKTQS